MVFSCGTPSFRSEQLHILYSKDINGTSGEILKKKITREVVLMETLSWCLLISLGCCRAIGLAESVLKCSPSKQGIRKQGENASLKNNLYSLAL